MMDPPRWTWAEPSQRTGSLAEVTGKYLGLSFWDAAFEAELHFIFWTPLYNVGIRDLKEGVRAVLRRSRPVHCSQQF